MLDVPLRAAGSPAREPRPPIRIVLADDSFLARAAIKDLLAGHPRMTVVGECEDAKLVPETVDEQRADVLITDIRMPPLGHDQGVRLAARLRETHPALAVIVLSTYAEVGYALKVFERGCDGRAYLLKDRIRNRKQLVNAIEAVLDGGSSIDPAIVEELVRAGLSKHRSGLEELTPRELETLALVAEGHSNGAIAERLVLTKRAVEKHVNAIFAKLELGDPEEVSPRVKAALLYLADRGEARVATQ
jgi:DNA-binding NarL/FixJ family response regulator